MPRMLFMLAAPRSFSSLVSTMIGQHPQIYGFPELHLMARNTVADVLRIEKLSDRFLGPEGLLRVLAQLHHGEQTTETVMEAALWLQERLDWPTWEVMDHVANLAEAQTGCRFVLEKSPSTSFNPNALERMRIHYPQALYIHVTRHPMRLRASMDEFFHASRRFTEVEREEQLSNSVTIWPVTQRNLLDFTSTMSPGQYLRIRGEDVLADAPRILAQVAEFLGLRTDDEAVAAMMRPEDSPYASIGPRLAPFGNDPKFLLSPKFRASTPRLPILAEALEGKEGARLGPEEKAYLRRLNNMMGYR